MRILAMTVALAGLLGGALRAQDMPPAGGGQDPKPPDSKGGDGSHEMLIRPFSEIWAKEIEVKQKDVKAYRARITLMVSDGYMDRTDVYVGEVVVKREDKKPPMLFWRVGTEKTQGDLSTLEVVERAVHDGTTVTRTDERDAKDKRYRKDSPWNDAELLLQELLLSGGKNIESHFKVMTLSDPKLAKKERTISKHLDDRLDAPKETDPADPNAKPPAENRVDVYNFALTPKTSALESQLTNMMLSIDPVHLVPVRISASLKGNFSLTVTLTDFAKVEPKDIPDTTFQIDLADFKPEE